MADNKFYQFNRDKNNMLNDYDYSVNVTRLGGLIKGKASSSLHNKLFYQISTMTAAIGQAMANKGYAMADFDIGILTSQLSNIMTRIDMGVYSTTAQMNAAIAAALANRPTNDQMNAAIAAAIAGLGGDNLTVPQVNSLIAAALFAGERFVILPFTRANSSGAGQVSYTASGVTWTPTAVVVIYYNSNNNYNGGSFVGMGVSDFTNQYTAGVGTQFADEESDGGRYSATSIIRSYNGAVGTVVGKIVGGLKISWTAGTTNSGAITGAFLLIR